MTFLRVCYYEYSRDFLFSAVTVRSGGPQHAKHRGGQISLTGIGNRSAMKIVRMLLMPLQDVGDYLTDGHAHAQDAWNTPSHRPALNHTRKLCQRATGTAARATSIPSSVDCHWYVGNRRELS